MTASGGSSFSSPACRLGRGNPAAGIVRARWWCTWSSVNAAGPAGSPSFSSLSSAPLSAVCRTPGSAQEFSSLLAEVSTYAPRQEESNVCSMALAGTGRLPLVKQQSSTTTTCSARDDPRIWRTIEYGSAW